MELGQVPLRRGAARAGSLPLGRRACWTIFSGATILPTPSAFDLVQAFARQKDPSAVPLTQADMAYWGEQYGRASYDFDAQSVRPYFAYQTVEGGILKTPPASSKRG